MKTGTTIGIAVVVGVVGYLAYKKIKDSQDAKKLLEGGDGSGTGSGAGAGTSTGSSAEVNPNIRALQLWYNIPVDGDAGRQTNGWTEYYWSDYENTYNADAMKAAGYPNLQKAKGVVTEANAKYYLDTLKAAQSPRQLYNVNKGKTAAAAATAAERTKRANQVKATYSGDFKLRAAKATRFYERIYDAASNTYSSTGKYWSYSANQTFLVPEGYSSASANRVKIVTLTTTGNLIVSVDPVGYGNSFLLLVDPFEIIVAK